MSALNRPEHAVVLRVVYDGAPEAGKTTSTRALARSLGREVYTPEERDGRTVYFDWLEHTGGHFDGGAIRCQILSVPGQECWTERRRYLLGGADVVIFVGDTRQSGWAATVERLHDLRALLDCRQGPPVAIVFQANHRDAGDTVPLEIVRAALRGRIALVETVALDGTGIREAFVLAVRLALERMVELQRLGAVSTHNVEQEGARLLAELRAMDPEDVGAEPTNCTVERAWSDPELDGLPQSELELPDPDVPTGLVWPPVEGRIVLREALQGAPRVMAGAVGERRVTFDTGFLAQSGEHYYDDVEQARQALLDWARWHSAAADLLSSQRCLAVASCGRGRYRLWQIVRQEPSLQELFIEGLDALSARQAAWQLANACRLLLELIEVCELRGVDLEFGLATVGISDSGGGVHVGDVPRFARSARPPAVRSGAGQVALILAELIRQRDEFDRAELCQEFEAVWSRLPQGAQVSRLVLELMNSPPQESVA